MCLNIEADDKRRRSGLIKFHTATINHQTRKGVQPLYKTPKSVQECIEILKTAPDGIFEVAGNRYSKSYLFSDVNYNTTSEVEQVGIFESYCKF